jgi:hypothetical protein
MGTTQTTDQTAKFDPKSMETFQGLQGGLGNMIKGYMSDPFNQQGGNPFFQTQQQLGQRQAQNIGGANMNNLVRNLGMSGLFGSASSSPAAMEMLNNMTRANTNLGANLGFLSPVMNALGMQQYAGNLASGYRPLQTGGKSVQSTGGLGTWLPQVGNMALGLATGGMSSAMPGGGPFASAQNYAPMSQMQPWGGGGGGAFGEGGGAFNMGGIPGAEGPGFGSLPQPPPPFMGGGGYGGMFGGNP